MTWLLLYWIMLAPQPNQIRPPECSFYSASIYVYCDKKPWRCKMYFWVSMSSINHTSKNVQFTERCRIVAPGRRATVTTESYVLKPGSNMVGAIGPKWRYYHRGKQRRKWSFHCTCRTGNGILLSERRGSLWSRYTPTRKP